ncbi:DnaJ domain-containing protein [Hamiltosporidium magnivora]|uniref:DnaJ domain-containing protein n=1 Tax=Hamiltosporidium magnivora TaxID=148818 RepID=A0A4Q9LDY2_9MICR|nr:DnaJ domain-containing protein [Hamiltosporidium magnivora]
MSLYKLLDIEKNASKKEIKKAFLKKSLSTHPDKGGDSKDFQSIKKASEILLSDKKQFYDNLVKNEKTFKEEYLHDTYTLKNIQNNSAVCRCGGIYDIDDQFDGCIPCRYCQCYIKISDI